MGRVIDRIDESSDIATTRYEWMLLVQPLIQALTKSVSESPAELYVSAMGATDAMPLLCSQTSEQLAPEFDLRVAPLKEDTDVPFVLVGNAGVGKTSLVHRFVHHLQSLPGAMVVRYDRHVEHDYPVAKNLPEADRLRGRIAAMLLREVQRSTTVADYLDESVLDHNPDQIEVDPNQLVGSVIESLKEAIQRLHDAGKRLYLIVDNLDLYPADVQHAGMEFASYAATWKGVSSYISVRPSTIIRPPTSLRNPRVFAVQPVTLDRILANRISYLWSPSGRQLTDDVLAVFRKSNLSLTSLWSGSVDHREETLKQFHERLVSVIADNPVARDTLHHLHNFHMREIIKVLVQLLQSGFFADERIEDLKRPQGSKSLTSSRIDFVTTYLRGPYVHHRGPTKKYPIADVNIFEMPGVTTDYLLVSVRILQLLAQRPPDDVQGRTVSEVARTLSRFGYPKDVTCSAIRGLANSELLVDCYYQKAWASGAVLEVEDDDHFVISLAGRFVVEKLLGPYAFRFCEAIADVTNLSRPDHKPWAVEKSYYGMIVNCFGVVDILLKAASVERLEKRISPDNVDEFKHLFYRGSKDFIVELTEECKKRATLLRKHVSYDFAEMTGLKSIVADFDSRIARAVELSGFSPH